jgi:ubiquinone/menaquinone biosynthesis C-methylase UbiE
MSDQIIVDMFNETALRDRPLSGIMGNEDYDEFEREHLLKFFKDNSPIGNILDAGSGLGRNIPVLQAAGFTDITAVDFSIEMINKFKQRFPNIPISHADLTDLSAIADNTFETTFCMYVLIHIVDDEMMGRAIAEMERVTHGTVIIGQVMDPLNKAQHRICKVREFFEIYPYFKKKKLDHFYKNLYEFPISPGSNIMNRISFAIFR